MGPLQSTASAMRSKLPSSGAARTRWQFWSPRRKVRRLLAKGTSAAACPAWYWASRCEPVGIQLRTGTLISQCAPRRDYRPLEQTGFR